MKKRFGAPVVALLSLVPASLRAEGPDVRAKLLVPERVAAGQSAPVVVELVVGKGWHVNSHTPTEKFLVPTSVTLSSTTGTLTAVRYPRDVERRFAFADGPLRVYEGNVRFEADLQLPGDADGRASVSASVTFQACNDRQCFPPRTIPLSADVLVSAASKSSSSKTPSGPAAPAGRVSK